MLEKMKNAWRIPELRKKIIYTFGMLLIYRLLCVIPVPGIKNRTRPAHSCFLLRNERSGGT